MVLLLLSSSLGTQAQSTQAQSTQNLFLLGKIWGLVKYFHPALATGRIDWDEELIRILPTYPFLPKKTLNDSLLAWIGKLGPIPTCPACSDTLLQGARQKPDFSWITHNNGLSSALQKKLLFLIHNRNITEQYYLQFISEDGITLPLSQHEKPYPQITYPDNTIGLVCLFRFWNAIEYWYPYKYGLPLPWDEVLKKFIPRMQKEQTRQQYNRDVQEMLAAIEDSHGWIQWPPSADVEGKYILPLTVKYVGRRWVITSLLNDSLKENIQPGDLLDSIDGTALNTLAEELIPLTPSSNPASGMNKLSFRITHTHNPKSRLAITRQDNHPASLLVPNKIPNFFLPPDLTPPYFSYAKDSAFCLLDGDIGYINMGKLKRADSLKFTALIARTKGLIIDTRQNQDESNGTGAGDLIGRLILPPAHDFMRFSSAARTYPGVYRLTPPSDAEFPAGVDFYPNKIAILINENSMSVGEFLAMAYKKAPKAQLIGTPTSGADGNVTYMTLPGAAIIQFTGLGVYHADGSETQRTGIHPDITVPQTLHGYQTQKDEQLDKALEWLQQ